MTGAYSFVCKYSDTNTLLARLNAMGGWTWRQGDSHWYGDYLACNPYDNVRIRIVDFPVQQPPPNDDDWRYEADIRSYPPTPARAWTNRAQSAAEVDAAFREVLRQIPAHDVEEIEWFD
jgi:hypothetical protein